MADDEEEEPMPDPTTTPAQVVKHRRKPQAGIATKLTQYEIAERRRQVGKLRMQGIGIPAIAKLLRVTEWTVNYDLKAIQSANARSISEFDKTRYIGDGLARFQELRERAWAEYYSATEARHKLKALDVLRAIQKDECDALLATGIIIKDDRPQQVEHRHTFQLDWTPEMKQKASAALLQMSLRSNLAEPTPELSPLSAGPVVDVVAVEPAAETSTEDDEDETEDP